MERRHVVVHGHVQGVFFRDTARALAERHHVTGWIRNRPDGAVEAVFEGEPGAVEQLVEFCRAGPPDARVDRVEVEGERPGGLTGFEAR